MTSNDFVKVSSSYNYYKCTSLTRIYNLKYSILAEGVAAGDRDQTRSRKTRMPDLLYDNNEDDMA